MIVVDYSQILIANCLAHGADFDKGRDAAKMEQIARHTILTTLLSYKQQFGKKYGDIVIAVDGKRNWRRDVFPHYKAKRKGNREESATDWQAIFAIGAQIREELQALFPFKVVREETAEADDVIAVLCKYTQDNELTQVGLEETSQKFLAISSDGDFKQLFKYGNYAQWSPIQRKAVARPEKTFLLEKLLTGDSGDGVPNVRSGDRAFVDSIRQKPITAKMKEAFFADPSGNGLLQEELRNLHRNRTLIDFDYIPDEVQSRILDTYKAAAPATDQNAVFEYFVKHRCRQLASDVQEFFRE